MSRFEIIIITIIALFTASLILLLPERAGVALVGITVIIAIAMKQVRSDWRLMAVVILTLVAHHVTSIINAFYFTLKGADVDAISFQDTAILMASSVQPDWFGEFGALDTGSQLYSRFLSLFYRFFGVSIFLGQSLSVLAYLFSCLLLIKFADLLGIRKWRLGMVALYGFLPSLIVFTSITMREAYQILLYLTLAYWAVKLRRNPSIRKILIIIAAGIGLAVLHNGLMVYALFMMALSLLWGLRINLRIWKRQTLAAFVVAFVLIAGMLISWFFYASDFGGASRALVTGEGADYAGVYRDRTTTSYDRASYGGKLDTSSLTSFVPSASMVFILYMLAPFPWQISDAADVYAALEGYLRLLLIYQALATWYRTRGERRSQWGFLIICFFSLEFLWAMGTANWGTAIRHHVVAYSLLILTGGPGLLRMVIRPFAKIKRRARRTRLVSAVNTRGLAGGLS